MRIKFLQTAALPTSQKETGVYNPTSAANGYKGESYAYVRKDSEGRERRYLCGVSSGLQKDAHGERMSAQCIQSFLRQAQEKDIPLYVNHGKDFTTDIGILEKSGLTENGDWYTEYRLYDQSDDMPSRNLEEADVVWKKVNGLPPYTKKFQGGFSIEGLIDPKKVERSTDGTILHDVELDPGVSFVTRPAYTPSVAAAIAKALSSVPVSKGLVEDALTRQELSEDYWRLAMAMDDAARKIFEREDLSPDEKRAALAEATAEWKAKVDQLTTVSALIDSQESPEAPAEKKAPAKPAAKSANKPRGKTMPENQVGKEAGDTAAMLSDVIATLQMLATQLGGGTVENQAIPEGEPEPMDETAAKEAEGSAEGSPEQIIEENQPGPSPSEAESMAAAKAMLAKLLGIAETQKAKPVDPVVKSLNDTAKVLKSLVDKQAMTEKALSNLLDGFQLPGLTAQKSEARPLPVQRGSDGGFQIDILAQAVAKHINAASNAEPEKPGDFRDVLKAAAPAFKQAGW